MRRAACRVAQPAHAGAWGGGLHAAGPRVSGPAYVGQDAMAWWVSVALTAELAVVCLIAVIEVCLMGPWAKLSLDRDACGGESSKLALRSSSSSYLCLFLLCLSPNLLYQRCYSCPCRGTCSCFSYDPLWNAIDYAVAVSAGSLATYSFGAACVREIQSGSSCDLSYRNNSQNRAVLSIPYIAPPSGMLVCSEIRLKRRRVERIQSHWGLSVWPCRCCLTFACAEGRKPTGGDQQPYNHASAVQATAPAPGTDTRTRRRHGGLALEEFSERLCEDRACRRAGPVLRSMLRGAAMA
jgi:hypothetical protein